MALTNKEVFTDKYMVVDRTKEGVAMAQFYDSYNGVANYISQYNEQDLKHLIVLRRRHDGAVSWRNVDLVPKFTIEFLDNRIDMVYLKPNDSNIAPVPFPVSVDTDLFDEVASRNTEGIYELILKEHCRMLELLNLIIDLDPV